MENNLILYYSRKGQNYVNGHIRDLPKGNTEYCAEFIQNAVGGDLFEIRTVQPYAVDYHQCTVEAKQEEEENARPELEEYLDDISQYNNIFVCGPCWWGTYPMAMFSLLERLDFHGKKIIPLMTHEGSGMGSCEHNLRKLCAGASFGSGMAVHGADAAHSEKAVAAWAKKNIG